MTSVDTASTFLKPFYHPRDQRQDTFMDENRHLHDELSAARVLIERQHQELESLRGIVNCSCMQPTRTSMKMVGKHKTHMGRVGLGMPNPPIVENELTVNTAKVERVITTASVRKVWNRFTPFLPTTERRCNWGDEPDSDADTASTCSLSLISARNDALDDSIVIGDSDTDRLFDGSSAQTFKPTLQEGSAIAACQDRSADRTRASDITTKASNTTNNNAQDSLVRHHGKIYPTNHSPTMPTDAHVKLINSTFQVPMLQRADAMLPQAMSLEVEKQSLRDALQQNGTYTGLIDSRTLLPDGFGTMIYENEVYVGDWEQGYYHGYGKHTNAPGDVYEGPFRYGLKQGKEIATMNFGDGRWFYGRFHEDKMREGVLYFMDGSWYDGFLENDKKNGFGLYCFSNGDEYEGQWKDDLMHGRGRMDWKRDASWYTGEWEFGIMQGIGTKVDTDGNIVHQGYFYDGERVVFAESIDQNDDYIDDDSGAPYTMKKHGGPSSRSNFVSK